jgi:hypothetical protein
MGFEWRTIRARRGSKSSAGLFESLFSRFSFGCFSIPGFVSADHLRSPLSRVLAVASQSVIRSGIRPVSGGRQCFMETPPRLKEISFPRCFLKTVELCPPLSGLVGLLPRIIEPYETFRGMVSVRGAVLLQRLTAQERLDTGAKSRVIPQAPSRKAARSCGFSFSRVRRGLPAGSASLPPIPRAC